MKLNPSKCKVIYFGRKNPKHSYLLLGEEVPPVDHYRELGVIVDPCFSFTFHVANLSRKCFVICNSILKSFSKRNLAFIIKIYNTYVLPIITYGIPFFSLTRIQVIEQVENIQRKFTKKLLTRNNIELNYPSRLALLELQPLELMFLKTGLILIYRIIGTNRPLRLILPPLLDSSSRNSTYEFRLKLKCSKVSSSLFPDSYISIWNQLPISIISAASLAAFRQSLDSFDFAQFLKGRASKAL